MDDLISNMIFLDFVNKSLDVRHLTYILNFHQYINKCVNIGYGSYYRVVLKRMNEFPTGIEIQAPTGIS